MQTFFQNNKKLIIIGGILIVIVFWGISTYNGLVSGNQSVSGSFAQIDTQLQRRFDLVPNLVSTVKGITKQESEVFGTLANARANYAGARTTEDKVGASNQFEGALSRLLVIAENYPQLQSSQAFRDLMTQLEGTENRIAVARKDYNDTVTNWNARVSRFPSMIIAGLFGFEKKAFLQTSEEAKVNPTVDFSK